MIRVEVLPWRVFHDFQKISSLGGGPGAKPKSSRTTKWVLEIFLVDFHSPGFERFVGWKDSFRGRDAEVHKPYARIISVWPSMPPQNVSVRAVMARCPIIQRRFSENSEGFRYQPE